MLRRAINEFLSAMKTKTPEAADVFLCEVCGYKTVSHPYDICTVCFWEQEMLEESEYNEPTGGPNDELSVNDARRNFEKLGAVSERLLQYVVPPKAGEIPEGAISADKIAERQEAARKRLRIKFKKLA